MKKILLLIVTLIILTLISCVIVDREPKYFLLVMLCLVFLGLCAILSYFFSFFVKNDNKINFAKLKNSLRNLNKVNHKKYKEIVCSVLSLSGYSELKKAKKNDYGIDYICDDVAFALIKNPFPTGDALVEKAADCKEFFDVYSVIIISPNFSESGIKSAKDSGVILWDSEKLIQITEGADNASKAPKKKTVKKETGKKIHIEVLDACDENIFSGLVAEILKKKYEYIGQDKNILNFKIDDRLYKVCCIKTEVNRFVGEKQVSDFFREMYGGGFDNALVVTNGYFHPALQENAKKMGVDLWNRDNLTFMMTHNR